MERKTRSGLKKATALFIPKKNSLLKAGCQDTKKKRQDIDAPQVNHQGTKQDLIFNIIENSSQTYRLLFEI